MHRWKHPDLWLAAGKWKRRTWRTDLISVMQKKCALQKQQLGLTKWRRWSLCRASPLLKGRGRRAIRRWHRVALMTGSVSMCRLKSPFARMKAATQDGSLRRRRLLRAVQSFRNRAVVTAYNTWEAHLRAEYERKRSMRATLSGWLGGTRNAFNTWRRQLELMSPAKQVAARWLNATMYAFFRRWSTDYKEFLLRLRSGLGHWLNAALARGLNSWKAQFAAYRTMLHAAVRLLSARLVRVLNTWIYVSRARRETMTRMKAIVETMRGSKVRAGLNQWRDNTLEAAARGKRMRGALSSMSPEGRAMRMGLNSWIQRAEQGAKMRQAGFMMRNASLKKAVNGWQEMAFAPNPMHTALMRWANQKMAAGLATWSEFIEERRLRRKALAGMANAPLSRGFRGWRAVAEAQAARLAGLDAVLSNMSPEGRAKRKAYNSWAGAVAQMALMRRAAGALFHRKASLAFNAWSDAVAAALERHERMCAAERYMAHLINRGLSKGLRAWLEYLELLDVAARAMSGMRNGGLRKGFNGWVMWTEERFEALATMERGLSGMKNGPLRAAWNSWTDKVFGAPDPALRALAHFANRELSKGFLSWVEATAQWLVMMNAVGALKHREAKAAVNQWRSFLAEQAESRAQMAKTIARMTSPAFKAFNQWSSMLEGLYVMRGAAKRLLNRQLSKCFESWQARYEEAVTMRDALRSLNPTYRAMRNGFQGWRAGGEAAAARLAMLQAKGRRMLMQHVVKALNKWREEAIKYRKMLGIVNRMMNRQKSRGFEAWQALAEELRAKGDKMRGIMMAMSPEGRKKRAALNKLIACSEQHKLMLRAGGALFHAKVKKALNNWAYVVEQTYRMQDSLGALMNAKLQRAFNSWLQTPPHPMKKVLARMINGPLAKAFTSWVEIYDAMLRAHRSMSHMMNQGLAKGLRAWLEYLELLDVAARAMSGMRNGGLRKGFNGWVMWTEERFEALEAMNKGMGGLRSGPKQKAFNTWAQLIYAPPDPAFRALAHLVYRKQSLALRTWVEKTEESLVMRGALKRLGNRQLSQCFEAWQARYEELAEEHAQMAKTIARMTSPAFKAFNQWSSMLEGLYVMRGAAKRLLNRQLSKCFESWQARYEESLLMRRAAGSLMHAPLARALGSWREYVEAQAADRALAMKAVLKMTPRGKAFNTWAAQMRALYPLKRAMKHWQSMQLVRALGSWEEMVQARESNRRAMAGFLKSGSRKGLDAWKAFVREKAKQQRRVGAALKRLSPEGRAMTKALNQWGEYLSGCVGPRERALKHMLNLALSKGWKSWTNMVAARTSARRALAHFAGSNLVKAVSAWEEYAEKERTMRGALRRLFSRQLSQCFETWQEAMEAAMEQKRRMRGILAGFGGPKRKALNTWKGHCEDLQMMKRSLARLVMGAQARAVGTWIAYVEARAAQAKRMHDALSGKSGALRYGLGRWAEYVEELRLVRKALGGLRGGGLKRGLAAWMDFVEAREDAQALARKAVLRITPRGKAWNSWLSYLESLVAGRRALSHMVNAGLSKCWGAWGAYLDMLQEKRMCLAHLFNRDLSRAWRAWEHKVAFLQHLTTLTPTLILPPTLSLPPTLPPTLTPHPNPSPSPNPNPNQMHEAELMAKSIATLRNLEAKNALVRWSRSAEEREEKLRKMRGTLYVLGDGHKTKKCLNSWKEFVGRNQRAMLSVARLFGGQKRKAWDRWHTFRVQNSKAFSRMLSAFSSALRKSFTEWASNSAYNGAAYKALAYWSNAGLRRSFLKLAGGLEALYAARRAMGMFMNQGLNKGFNSWLGHLERRAVMRASLMAMVHAATKKCLNTWAAEAERRAEARAKFEAAAFTLRNLPLKKAYNSITAAAEGNAPLRRAMAHWKNQPLSRALFFLKANAAMLRQLKAQVHRWKHGKLSAALNSWIARTSKRGSSAQRAVMGIINRPQRLALNSWLAFAAGRRRLAGLLNTFRSPAKRRGFNQWRAVTKTSARKGPKSPPKSPHQWRMIKAMTWRECCSWLTRVGIPVSRSPPTLIRTLKEGFVYQELVRKISPAYYIRHKVAHCHETNGVFLMVQQFLDTELVISFIGCQKLDVIALESGKAIDHLQLVMLFKTILVGVHEREGVHK